MVYRKVDGRDKTEYHIPLTSGEKRLCCDDRSWMVFHLLEDAEECDTGKTCSRYRGRKTQVDIDNGGRGKRFGLSLRWSWAIQAFGAFRILSSACYVLTFNSQDSSSS